MILKLTSPKIGGRVLSFYLQDEGFTNGYTYQWEQELAPTWAHPPLLRPVGGKVDDLNVTLDIIAGLHLDDSGPGIFTGPRDARELADIIGDLYTLSTPEKKGSIPLLVQMTIGGTETWFVERGVLVNVKSNWLPPWDVETGRAMRCKFSFTFMIYRNPDVGKPWGIYDFATDAAQ